MRLSLPIRRGVLIALQVLLLAWSLPGAAGVAETYTVCPQGCPYRTIGAALAAAAPGTTVTVGPGTYREVVTLRSGVSLVGAGAAAVTVRGVAGLPVLQGMTGDIGPTTLVQGFTLTGGDGQGGGGVYLRRGASPTLRANRIVGNRAANGGGLYIDASSPRLERNVIADNRASQHGGGLVIIGAGAAPTLVGNVIENNIAQFDGGGVVIQNDAAPRLTGNTIAGNVAMGMAPSAGVGGGVKIRHNAHATLTANRIEHNQAHADGGGLYVEQDSRPVIRHNVIAHNWAASFGGGLVIREAQGQLINNLIVYNHAPSGSGLFIRVSQGVELINNTFANNSSDGVILSESGATLRNNLITGHTCGICTHGTSQGQLSHNDVWGNNRNYGGIAPGTGDLSVDPGLLPGQYGPCYQASNSPLKDRGQGTAASLGLSDRAALVDGFPDTGQVDIGYHHPLPSHRGLLPAVLVGGR